MKVSIITTCYNRAYTIKDAIESVLNQDYPLIEYIIVDGASTDETMEIVHQYSNRITKIVSEQDRGMYEAINKGIRMATGDIIGLMHSDDVFYNNQVISSIVAAFKRYNPDMIYGNGIFVDAKNHNRTVRNWISGKKRHKRFKLGWLPLHTTTYFKSEVLKKYGLYNETYQIAADTEFLTRYMYKYKIKTHYLNQYIVKMKIGGASTDLKKAIIKWSEDIRVYRRYNLNPYIALPAKILLKTPQLITRKRLTE
ncbi:glycosyltransferase family 2 protein [Parabacteroides sp. FAFU027]|uniref:glycosyltransferase family 2 protein n=1 Tax=Parabacteroides sp. FAFU027 TaxID=2922715 RepID=UPI001FAF6535|nr:glycosyltransferase family 2 protein [Parabacteroides sp. FAFU027]